MKNKLIIIIGVVFVSLLALSECVDIKQIYDSYGYNNIIITREPNQSFLGLSKGLKLRVLHVQPQSETTGNWKRYYHYSGNKALDAPTENYVRSMGLQENLEDSEYTLDVTVERFDFLAYRYQMQAWADLRVSLKDSKGCEVFLQEDVSATSILEFGLNDSQQAIDEVRCAVMNEAYTQALEQINWNRIASFLRTE